MYKTGVGKLWPAKGKSAAREDVLLSRMWPAKENFVARWAKIYFKLNVFTITRFSFINFTLTPYIKFNWISLKMWKWQISILAGFFSQFHNNFILTTAINYLKKECKECLDLVSELHNTYLVKKLNTNNFHFVQK